MFCLVIVDMLDVSLSVSCWRGGFSFLPLGRRECDLYDVDALIEAAGGRGCDGGDQLCGLHGQAECGCL